MSIDASTLGQFAERKVVLVVVPAEGKDAVEIEGTVTAANELGIAIRPKGQSKIELYEAAQIEDVRAAAESIPALKRKELKPVQLGQARSHLLERHGWTLAAVNAITEDDAFTQHQGLNHTELDLGHVHAAKEETPAAQAVAEQPAEG